MRLAILAAALVIGAPAFAQQSGQAAAPACATMDAKLASDMADWNGKAALASGTGPSDIAKASIALGKGYEAQLVQTPKISFPVQPEKPAFGSSWGAFRVHGSGSWQLHGCAFDAGVDRCDRERQGDFAREFRPRT